MAEKYTFEWLTENTVKPTDEDFKTASANMGKNRYKNVLANEKTLVKMSNKKYINANYVCGKRYISCQAPTSTTIEDFYNMLWEQQTPVIVMLTKYEEKGKVKASPYFPETGMKRYGNFIVKIGSLLYNCSEDEGIMGTQVKELIVENRALKQKRSIIHIHYISWPDFGVPSDLKQITDLLFMVMLFRGKLKNSELNGPVVVHCSAGIGRSGTFICMMRYFDNHFYPNGELKDITFESEFDLVRNVEERIKKIDHKLNEEEIKEISANLVLSLRMERKGMIQTADQYQFLLIILKEFYNTIYDTIELKDNIYDSVLPYLSDTLKENLNAFRNPLIN